MLLKPFPFESDSRLQLFVMGTGSNERPLHDRIMADHRQGPKGFLAVANIYQPGRLFAVEIWIRTFGDDAREWACGAHFTDQNEARRWCHDVIIAWLDDRSDLVFSHPAVWFERVQRSGESWQGMFERYPPRGDA